MARASNDDAVEVSVGPPVSSAVQSPSLCLSGRLLDRGDAAWSGKRGLTGQPFRIVAGGDQQDSDAVGPNPDDVQKLRSAPTNGLGDPAGEFFHLSGQLLDAPGQQPRRTW
jgi:hypothetical protein